MASPYAMHRKPVGSGNIPAALRPHQPPSAVQQQPPPQQFQDSIHAHTRSQSSNVFPLDGAPFSMSPTAAYAPGPGGYPAPQVLGHSRRTASTATASTTSSQGGGGGAGVAGGPIPGRMPSTVSISLRRTGSSRSGQSINSTSYVALMRKQKATVWCDRAQHEDPRVAAQIKAAKMRAAQEVVGGAHARPVNKDSGVRSKIRHHGAAKQVGYSPATLLVGAQVVPARLSASEVGDEDNSEDGDRRSGSERNSLGGAPPRANFYGARPGRLSAGSTPPSGPGHSPNEPTAGDNSKTPMPGLAGKPADYFAADRASKHSGSSEERKFGNVGSMEAPATQRNTEPRTPDELNRRGSVDERAMTMRGPRLYVANPDLSD